MKINNYLVLLIAAISILSCNKKDDFNYPDGTVGISKITYFPIVTLNGAAYIVVAKGATYTDQGVTAKAGGQDVPVTVAGSVDVSTPGVYTLTYTAKNSDGFSASVSRTVVVYFTDASASSNDFSGDYARSTNGQIASWTKLAPGVYKVVNPGGAVGATLTVIAINPTGFQIKIPDQISSDGNTTFSSNESYSAGPPPTYMWKINNPGYGPSIRTFTKI